MSYQLVERAVPALLVAGSRRLGLQTRMGEGEFGPSIDRPPIDLDTRLPASFLGLASAGPAPAHDQTDGLIDFEILAAALVLAAVKHPEPHPEATAHTDIGFGKEYRSVVGAPPAGDTVRHRQGIEDDRGASRNPTHQGQA